MKILFDTIPLSLHQFSAEDLSCFSQFAINTNTLRLLVYVKIFLFISDTNFNFFLFFKFTGLRRGGRVFAAADAARDAAPVASAERRVAPKAGHDERQEREADPAFGALLVRGGTAFARMLDEVALRVGHAMVEHALGARDTSDRIDARLRAVGRVLAAAALVILHVERFLAVPAALLLPPAVAPVAAVVAPLAAAEADAAA